MSGDHLFEYTTPTPAQKQDMDIIRQAAQHFVDAVHVIVPEGPDRTYLIRKFRECVMWAMISVVKMPDGSPRQRSETPLKP